MIGRFIFILFSVFLAVLIGSPCLAENVIVVGPLSESSGSAVSFQTPIPSGVDTMPTSYNQNTDVIANIEVSNATASASVITLQPSPSFSVAVMPIQSTIGYPDTLSPVTSVTVIIHNNKISQELQDLIQNFPNQKVDIVLTTSNPSNQSIQVTGIIGGACEFLCNKLGKWYCTEFLPQLKNKEFDTRMITTDGHVFGTIRAGNIPSLSQIETISYISKDNGVTQKVVSFQQATRLNNESSNSLVMKNNALFTANGNVNEKITVGIISKQSYASSDLIDEINDFICKYYPTICDLCNLFDLTNYGDDFQPLGITSDGVLIGQINKQDLGNLTSNNNIVVFKDSDEIGNSIITMGYFLTPVTVQQNPVPSVPAKSTIIPQPVEIPIGTTYNVGQLNIKADYEPIRLFGIIPIPFTKSNTVRIDISNGNLTESKFLEINNPITIQLNNFEIGTSGDSSIRIVDLKNQGE